MREKAFLELMRYSPFVKVDDIKTDTDLRHFFASVDSHARASKYRKHKPVFGNMQHVKEAAAKALHRLQGSRGHAKIINPNHEALASGKRSASYAQASRNDATVVVTIFKKGKPTPDRVYKDRNGRWRDSKGAYRKAYIEV